MTPTQVDEYLGIIGKKIQEDSDELDGIDEVSEGSSMRADILLGRMHTRALFALAVATSSAGQKAAAQPPIFPPEIINAG